jgi:TatD DNase family protein
MLIDTHCHLDAPIFAGKQNEVLTAARAAGVQAFIVPSIERNNFLSVLTLCQHHSNCFPALGIHPLFVNDASLDDLSALKNYIQLNQIVAIGEIGLDYYESTANSDRQRLFLTAQLKLAQEFNLPVLLHCRRAYDDLIKLLQMYPQHKGIVHAFNGSRQQAERLIGKGYKLGFGGAITYLRAKKIRQLAIDLPLNALVLETDAPDMSPSFLSKDEVNQPKYIVSIAQTLADLRGVTFAEIACATTENAMNIISRPALKTDLARSKRIS